MTATTIHDLRVKKFATITAFAKALKVSTYKASQWDKSRDMTLCYFKYGDKAAQKNISNLAAVLNVSYDTIVDCLKAVWPYQFKETQQPPPPVTPQSNGYHAILFVTPNAPREVIEAAYRTLAKKYHPDYGGSKDQMQRINAAKEALLK